MNKEFYSIKINRIEKPIKNATTLVFDIPKEYEEEFAFKSGQHLCFRFTIDGKEERRMYSLHNSPFEQEAHRVSVKLQEDGLVSNYIAEILNSGDSVEVTKPMGDFVFEPNQATSKNYYLFAAGSGITPIFSILKTILLQETESKVYLLYGNRAPEDILFSEELNEWQKLHSNRLKITQTLSKRFLDLSLIQWEGKRGRINDEMVDAFLADNPTEQGTSEYYICGPNDMNENIQDILHEYGIPDKFIHYEYFSASNVEYDEDLDSHANAVITASLGKEKYQVRLQKDETILQALQREGISAPYSCQSGICGSCKAKLLEGEAKMKTSIALSNTDKENGMILTCQSLAQTPVVKIEFS